MKFKMINDADVAVLREARKILKKLKKQQNKLNAAEDAALDNNKLDYQTVALKNWRMLDELDALHISVYGNGDMSLDAQ